MAAPLRRRPEPGEDNGVAGVARWPGWRKKMWKTQAFPRENDLQCEAPKIAKLVYNSNITRTYGRYIYS